MFIAAQLLHGIGSQPLISLTPAYLNESVKKSSAPLYLAIYQIFAAIGPIVGFAVGGILLKFFTDNVPGLNLTPKSPLWVGAWWPGFLFCGCLLYTSPSPRDS